MLLSVVAAVLVVVVDVGKVAVAVVAVAVVEVAVAFEVVLSTLPACVVVCWTSNVAGSVRLLMMLVMVLLSLLLLLLLVVNVSVEETLWEFRKKKAVNSRNNLAI